MPQSTHSLPLEVRPYRSGDAAATLAVFLDAVTVTASADYSIDQIAAWSRPEQRTVSAWGEGMRRRNSYVAVRDSEIAGFSDVSAEGYIDMLFVSPRHSRKGVARALLAALEAQARGSGAKSLSADVSITARSFFQRHGFAVVAEQQPITAGVRMTNFHMAKTLEAIE